MLTCWGNNLFGQLTVPKQYFGAGMVSAGALNTCAVKHGEVGCWGMNQDGQSLVPEEIQSRSDTQVVSAGSKHTCAIDVRQQVQCWGMEDRTLVPRE
mmetsp:Transcript_30755/g.25957  ORF Transcript_30755/g.25957 Transcript_30755/m.25957 type:complete len:97 (-) Transcript_30755:148-438(-)